MRGLRPGLFAQPDCDHFEQAGRDARIVFRMRFHPSQYDDAVGFVGVTIQVDNRAVVRRSERDGLHRGAYRRADGLFRHAQSVQDFRLSFGGRAAVTAHRGNKERLSARCFHGVGNAAQQFYKAAHAPAAGGDGDARAGNHFGVQSGFQQALAGMQAHIGNVVGGQVLRDEGNIRKGQRGNFIVCMTTALRKFMRQKL